MSAPNPEFAPVQSPDLRPAGSPLYVTHPRTELLRADHPEEAHVHGEHDVRPGRVEVGGVDGDRPLAADPGEVEAAEARAPADDEAPLAGPGAVGARGGDVALSAPRGRPGPVGHGRLEIGPGRGVEELPVAGGYDFPPAPDDGDPPVPKPRRGRARPAPRVAEFPVFLLGPTAAVSVVLQAPAPYPLRPRGRRRVSCRRRTRSGRCPRRSPRGASIRPECRSSSGCRSRRRARGPCGSRP